MNFTNIGIQCIKVFWPKCTVFLVLHVFTIFAFDHEKEIKQKLQNLFFYQKYVHLGKNTFIHCSRITVVHIHVTVFLKNLPDLLTVTQTESNQEVTTK